MSYNIPPTLVLTNSYEIKSFTPLSTLPGTEAFRKVYSDSAISVVNYKRKILTSGSHEFYFPSVISEKTVRKKPSTIVLKKYTLCIRDEYKCQYCNCDLLPHTTTIDHVFPESKGGKKIWDNTVAACIKCNSEKGNQLPKGRWKPKTNPYIPSYGELLHKRAQKPIEVFDESWIDFLPGFKDIIVKNKNY